MWLSILTLMKRGSSTLLGTVYRYLYEAGGNRVLDADSNPIKVKS